MKTRKLVEYINATGVSEFGKWFSKLDSETAVKITTYLYRLSHGNFLNTKSVGKGVFEYKVNTGPGYRIYFGQEEDILIILLTGGSKKRQNMDIKRAHRLWMEYKTRKSSSELKLWH